MAENCQVATQYMGFYRPLKASVRPLSSTLRVHFEATPTTTRLTGLELGAWLPLTSRKEVIDRHQKDTFSSRVNHWVTMPVLAPGYAGAIRINEEETDLIGATRSNAQV